MTGTRSSARLSTNSSSPQSTKRKADSSPASGKSKKGKKGEKQQTLEETLDLDEAKAEQDQPADVEMKDAVSNGEGADAKPDTKAMDKETKGGDTTSESTKNGHVAGEDDPKRDENCSGHMDTGDYSEKLKEDHTNGTNGAGKKTNQKALDSFKGDNREGESKDDPEKALKDSRGGPGLNALDGDKKDVGSEAPHDDTHEETSTKPQSPKQESGGAVEESSQRADSQPSSILEKGVIYFFTRGRVGVDTPESVQDLQRSYFVLRPLPDGAKLGEGAIEDSKTNRLMALPKKVWPKSGRDRFMVFVEKAKASMEELKEEFFQGSEYTTKTTGVRQNSPVTPIGEGVYAITAVGNRSEAHLAYMLTVPREPGEMQDDVGIRAKGSFIMSLKNPQSKGPAYASLPQSPDFPQEFIDEFRGRGWMPAAPKHLDYPNAQVLLIGESLDDSHALDEAEKDKKNGDKITPLEEMEKLEHEDELRVEHFKGDDTIYADLGINAKDYPDVATTW